MIRGLIVAGVVALGVSAVVAQTSVIKDRQDAMKQMGAATKGPGGMLKGTEPFNLATVQTSLRSIADAATKAQPLFPEGSGQGDTAAAPKIWQTKADFDNKMKGLAAAANKALADIKDEATVKTSFPEVAKNCGGCHTDYRLKRG